jgi:hypothetical protein
MGLTFGTRMERIAFESALRRGVHLFTARYRPWTAKAHQMQFWLNLNKASGRGQKLTSDIDRKSD